MNVVHILVWQINGDFRILCGFNADFQFIYFERNFCFFFCIWKGIAFSFRLCDEIQPCFNEYNHTICRLEPGDFWAFLNRHKIDQIMNFITWINITTTRDSYDIFIQLLLCTMINFFFLIWWQIDGIRLKSLYSHEKYSIFFF